MPSLLQLRAAHPRIIFTAEAEADLRHRLAHDPLAEKFIASLRTRSDALAQLPTVPYRPVTYNEFGIQMLEVSRGILNRVTTHAFLHRLQPETVYQERVWREVSAALAYPTWNPAHFLDTAEMLVAFAFAYDWLHDAWSPEQRASLRDAMVTRGLQPGLDLYTRREGTSAFFVQSTANWNSVCNAGLLTAALAIAEHQPRLAEDILSHAVASLPHARQGYEPDGATEEGATYWGYGTEFFCLAAASLQSALGDDAGLLGTEAFRRTTLYRLHVQGPTGRNFSYADCWSRSGASFAYSFLADRFGPSPARAQVRALVTEWMTEPRLGTGHRLSPLIPLSLPAPGAEADRTPAALDAFFGGRAQLAMLRSSWGDPRAPYVGFKAGAALANHSHLDLGSFVFDCAGVRWSTDLGPDDYVLPGYFRSEQNRNLPLDAATRHLPHRWSYFRNNNLGHSTLNLAGELQSRDAVAPFVARSSTPALACAIADLSACHPEHATRWHRGVALVDRAWLAVHDEVAGIPPGILVEWVLLTEAHVTIAADALSAVLEKEGETLDLVFATSPPGTLEAAPARPPTAAENQNEGVTRISFQWIADTRETVIEVHLLPRATAPRARSLGPLATWPRSPAAG